MVSGNRMDDCILKPLNAFGPIVFNDDGYAAGDCFQPAMWVRSKWICHTKLHLYCWNDCFNRQPISRINYRNSKMLRDLFRSWYMGWNWLSGCHKMKTHPIELFVYPVRWNRRDRSEKSPIPGYRIRHRLYSQWFVHPVELQYCGARNIQWMHRFQ